MAATTGSRLTTKQTRTTWRMPVPVVPVKAGGRFRVHVCEVPARTFSHYAKTSQKSQRGRRATLRPKWWCSCLCCWTTLEKRSLVVCPRQHQHTHNVITRESLSLTSVISTIVLTVPETSNLYSIYSVPLFTLTPSGVNRIAFL
jgi:hypothetical protein